LVQSKDLEVPQLYIVALVELDRSDVGLVVHYNNPSNLLGYAQEIGRAGRDGEKAMCLSFFDESRIELSETSRKFALPSIGFVEGTHSRLKSTYLKRKTPESRDGFSTSKFIRMLENTLKDKDDFKNPDQFLNRTREAIAILKQAGYIVEDDDEPFKLLTLNPGNKRHVKLQELTQMNERAEVDQIRAVEQFFTAENPDQQLLWKLLV